MIPVLYHGTSSENAGRILAEGLRDPCLTDSEERAFYYAECCAELQGGSEAVIRVCLDTPDSLRVDIPSIEEPVMCHGRSDEEIWKRATEEAERLGLSGWAELPWDAALRISGSVRYRGLIPARRLELVEG